jgi:competence protein ComEA
LITAGISGYFLYQSYQPNQDEEITISQEPTTKPLTRIMIDIAGAVNKPGVYEVTVGARLKDAINLAEGITTEAEINFFNRNFNLARYVTDQEKIYIPSLFEINNGLFVEASRTLDYINPAPTSHRSGENLVGATTKTNINFASIDELDKLPGIGKITADKIIQNRPYKSIEELLTKKIVNKNVWEKIKNLVIVN